MANAKARDVCTRFFVEVDGGAGQKAKKKKQYALAEPEAIRGMFKSGSFSDLEYLQDKLENLVHGWNQNLFHGTDNGKMHKRLRNNLLKCGYRVPPTITIVGQAIVTSPPPKRAARRRFTSRSKKGKSAKSSAKRRRQGDDEQDNSSSGVGDEKPELMISMEEEDEEDRRQLTNLKQRIARSSGESRKKKRPHLFLQSDHPPDEGIFDSQGNVLKRRPWTVEEKNCIKQGVKQHGLGEWAEIKSTFGHELRNRTSVQIKDCWRTMLKHKEVTEDGDDEEED